MGNAESSFGGGRRKTSAGCGKNRKRTCLGKDKNYLAEGSRDRSMVGSEAAVPPTKLVSLDFQGPRPPMPKSSEEIGAPVFDLRDGEDVCPTCLEEYTDSNPRIDTACEHQFHLSCILEWYDRNPHCPICARRMEFADLA
uniref:RING-type E3 ubiquitin transferase n=1 Tax=Rhodosorus marinus TaxID=101924 RepID=A0A7S0G020_9RHOD|mmetsp:Transcript_15584/g.22835  ORF Transcript_15584/g.22835 Transcript_15584/m.22835 type:complete len:140 (+) Transcript_15584:176-595(+)